MNFNESIQFLCKIFGIKLANKQQYDIDTIIDKNCKVINEICEKSSKKYVKNIAKTYEMIMKFWKNRKEQINFANHFDVDLQIGSEFLANQVELKRNVIIKQLLILKFCCVIRQTESHSTKKGVSKTNTYYLNDISNKKAFIKRQLKILDKEFKNVMKNITKEKIDKLINKQISFEI